jgi:hypothetical protein
LNELDISIVKETDKGKDYSGIGSGDVVIFPAFGATVQDMQYFRDMGVNIVDTTCPWVAKVRGRILPRGCVNSAWFLSQPSLSFPFTQAALVTSVHSAREQAHRSISAGHETLVRG